MLFGTMYFCCLYANLILNLPDQNFFKLPSLTKLILFTLISIISTFIILKISILSYKKNNIGRPISDLEFKRPLKDINPHTDIISHQKNEAKKLLKQLITEKGNQSHLNALNILFLGNDCPDRGPEDCIHCPHPEESC
jgi:histone acetyltransferase (RNA polymerase elongator complex component)